MEDRYTIIKGITTQLKTATLSIVFFDTKKGVYSSQANSHKTRKIVLVL